MPAKKSLSIIIPNYNGAALLREFLPYTIAAAEYAELDYETIVVDDASKDASVEFLETHYRTITLLKNETNKGFSYSCNRGMAVAKKELLFFLNSDVKLSRDYFVHQLKYFERDDTFGVMGRIMGMDEKTMEDTARFPKFLGCKLKTVNFFYARDNKSFLPTTYLSGANALVDAEKMRALNGFDPIFSPFYAEDLDLGLRAWRLGWKCYYEHESICFHQVSSTTKNFFARSLVKQIYYRNRFLVHAIHLEGMAFGFWYIHVLMLEVIPKLFLGQFWILKSFGQFLKQSKNIRESRSRLNLLMEKNKSSNSLFQVKKLISLEMEGREIVWR